MVLKIFSVSQSVCHFVEMSFCPNVFLSKCLSVYLFLSKCLSVQVSFCLSFSIQMFFCLSVFLSLSFCPSVFLYKCLLSKGLFLEMKGENPVCEFKKIEFHKSDEELFSNNLSVKMLKLFSYLNFCHFGIQQCSFYSQVLHFKFLILNYIYYNFIFNYFTKKYNILIIIFKPAHL